jgi:hypothetical protein
MAEHARLSPSGGHRWINCPPSLRLEEPFPNTSSKYALEGTIAHEVARLAALGDDISAYDEVEVFADGEVASSHPVDVDMRRHAETYRDIVRGHVSRIDGALLVERRVNFGTWIDVPDQFGTADAVILGSPASQELVVIDYKYGIGVKVSPKGNEQLMLYALGALYEYDALGDWQKITMVIHQPRVSEEPQEHTISVYDLLQFGVKARDAAKLAIAGEGDYAPGEKTCRFCRAKTICPALNREVDEAVAADFKSLVPGNDVALPPDQLGRYMDRVGMIEDWCKAVRAEAELRLTTGQPVPGWKLVRGRQGDRNWTSAEEAETEMRSLKIKVSDMFVSKVITPTAAEKLLKKTAPDKWRALQPLITRAEGKLSVAPATDPRPAEDARIATDDFRHLIEA